MMQTFSAWLSCALKVSYYLDLFGCAKNQVDAENMMANFAGAGWPAAKGAADADMSIVYSCGFIESAKQESINAVLAWRKLYPEKKILLAGCLGQRYAKELAEALPEADGIFGTDDIAKIIGEAKPVLPGSRPLLSLPGSAYIKISEGCDNGCAYCAIPLIRGPLRCRPIGSIVAECKDLLARGIKELCIIGQDIGAYKSEGAALPELLSSIAEIKGDFWVRLLYMHPGHFPLQILGLMENDPRFLPYFDIPFQHASQKILSAMGRPGNAENYIALAETIRGRLPGAVIRTTFLLGFPGETDDDFAALLDFQEKLRPDWLGCFAFSREEGTLAHTMKAQVPKKTAAKRQREIEERQITIAEKNMARFVGKNLEVLLEEQFCGNEGSAENELWLGRLYCHAPEVDGAAVVTGLGEHGREPKAGSLLPCRVIAQRGLDLEVRPL
jgi:ribosomal protein S12 methylthiotransferase